MLRHAKSSWADQFTDDWERPLTDRGSRDARHVGELLRRLSLVPDAIITSDAVRAQTTAQIVAEAAGYALRVALSPGLYHATPAAIVDVVKAAPQSAARLMIVGHNPGFEDFVSQLSGQPVGLSTATLVQLDLPIDRWSDIELTTQARLIESWDPGDL